MFEASVQLKLYLLSQSERVGYDTFSGCVVRAESEEAARQIHPKGDRVWRGEDWWWTDNEWWPRGPTHDRTWTSPDNVEVTYLGEAKLGDLPGVVLTDFRAG